MRWIKIAGITIGCACILLFSGCTPDLVSGGVKPDTKAGVKTEAPKEVKKVTVTIYAPTDSAMGVKATPLTVTEDKATPENVLKEFLLTEQKRQFSVYPKTLEVKSVKVDNGVAFVEFNDVFVKEVKGGSLGEQLEVAGIVNTLTEFKDIKAVQFLVNGKVVTSLTGHMDLTQPVARMSDMIVK